jgi:pentatricopeptide repeat protein
MLEMYMKAGQCDQAIAYFGEMRSNFFVSPTIDTYDILLLGLIESNRFGSALSIFGDLMHKVSVLSSSFSKSIGFLGM